jgi:hypothetical protein
MLDMFLFLLGNMSSSHYFRIYLKNNFNLVNFIQESIHLSKDIHINIIQKYAVIAENLSKD